MMPGSIIHPAPELHQNGVLKTDAVHARFQPRSVTRFICVIVTLCASLLSGCMPNHERLIRATAIATGGLVQVKPVPDRSKFTYLKQYVTSIPRPSERTELLLRNNKLELLYDEDPDAVIDWLQKLAQTSPTMEEIHGLAEIAEIHARWADASGDSQRASRLYATAAIHAYAFLFDSNIGSTRNHYDPQFRSICDVYNRSLEGLLREVIDGNELQPGRTIQVGDGEQEIELEIRVDGRWQNQTFTRFELVSDYEASGIDNQYHTYGLGVPLIAVRQQQAPKSGFEKYYPPEITIPMTAFMHLSFDEPRREQAQQNRSMDESGAGSSVRHAILTLYDPLERTLVDIESEMVPLESDITTPLAYGLRDPFVNKGMLATASLLNAEFAPESYGLFMLEPFDPAKIPVVMVHGFWSSPVTWVHMFNDLRANRDIHENYQFWFYSYPTGQPFWISAQQMRRDLAQIREEVDPRRDAKPLDQMVLVGHSMGGLMSIMQTIDSGHEFWNIISDNSIDQLKGDPLTIELLRDTFYFRPNPSIERVITMGTPFRGSEFSNLATQWFSQKLFTLPAIVTKDFRKLAKQNADILKNKDLLTTTTSTDSLAPEHPMFAAIASASQAKSVKTHNIIGRLDRKSFFWGTDESKANTGDGVVSVQSAQNELAVTQDFVPAEHSEIHQHSSSIFAVRQILLEHLVEYDRIRYREIPEIPVRQAGLLEEVNASGNPAPIGPVGYTGENWSIRR